MGSSAFTATDADTKEAELKQLRKQISSLRESLESDRGKQSNLRSRLRSSEREIGRLSRSLKILGKEMTLKYILMQKK